MNCGSERPRFDVDGLVFGDGFEFFDSYAFFDGLAFFDGFTGLSDLESMFSRVSQV